jgi:hypothetical protein
MRKCTTTPFRKCLEMVDKHIAKNTFHSLTCKTAWCTFAIARTTHVLYVRKMLRMIQCASYATHPYSPLISKCQPSTGPRTWNVSWHRDNGDMGNHWRIRRRRNRRKWKRAMIVKVDAQDFVISVEPEAVDSAMKEIRRSEAMPEATRICKGPWHYRSGKGTALPLSAFPENRYRPGSITKTCGECLEKSGKRSATPLGVKPTEVRTGVNKIEHALAAAVPAPATNGGLMHKWEVTVVKTTVVTVYAKDYLDAGVEAGEGDVTNVRRLD